MVGFNHKGVNRSGITRTRAGADNKVGGVMGAIKDLIYPRLHRQRGRKFHHLLGR